MAVKADTSERAATRRVPDWNNRRFMVQRDGLVVTDGRSRAEALEG